MPRWLIACAGVIVLTWLPVEFQKRIRQDPADFPELVKQLKQVNLCPQGWQLREGEYEFNDYWRQRLGLHDYRTVLLKEPTGTELTVLVMLSETGEQLFHTPSVCYEAQGCETRGEESPIVVNTGNVEGETRAVEVIFDEFVDSTPKTAVFSYWTADGWVAPPRSAVRDQLGLQPYLLKIQLLVEDARPSDEQVIDLINEYFAFLGREFRRVGV